jgi:hypothetical protein
MRRRHALLLAAVIAFALITWLRIHLVDTLPDQGYFAKYLTFADRILAGRMPRDRLGDLSPAYLWTIVLMRRLGCSVTAIRDLQITMLSVAAALCGIAAARVGGWWAGGAAIVLVLANRAALVVATELEPETLILLAIAASLAALVQWEHDRRPSRIVAAGLFLGLAVTGRPVAALALIATTVWLAARARRFVVPFVVAAAVPLAIVLAVNGTLTGHVSIMEPGTGLYDGNNPLATGCAGVLPRIIADLDATSSEPDYLHVAYRLVAARANGGGPDSQAGNRYWSAKSLAWTRTYPIAAARLFAWKALLSIHNYDIYDLATTKRKSDELPLWPAIPFGLLTTLAIAAVVLRHSRAPLVPILLFAAATIAALIIFNVSARQRDALLPPLAILGGVGVIEIFRRRDAPLVIACASVIGGALLLGISCPPQREDGYGWWAAFQSARDFALGRPAAASILRTAYPSAVDPRSLRAAAMEAIAATSSPEVQFDAALALEKTNAWTDADVVLASLGDYVPRRENRAVSSVAYYRARAALHLGRDPRLLLARAAADAPGDPDVLAARALAGDAASAQRLDLLHDPFTRDYALAAAYLDQGDRVAAFALRDRLLRVIPEWRRPVTLR